MKSMPSRGDAPLQDVAIADAVGGELVRGEVDASARRILVHVAKDVDELQGDTELIGALERDRVTESEDAHAHAPDDRRDEVRIRAQLVPRRVARGREVHRDAVDEHLELLDRDRVAAHGQREHPHHGIGGIARARVVETATMMLETRMPRLAPREVRIVVHLAREVVQRVDGDALLARQRDEPPVEVGGLAPRHVLAEALGRAHVGKRRSVNHLRPLFATSR